MEKTRLKRSGQWRKPTHYRYLKPNYGIFFKEGLSTFKLHTGLKIKASRIICMVKESVTKVSIIYNHITQWGYTLRGSLLDYSAFLQTAQSMLNMKIRCLNVIGQNYLLWISKTAISNTSLHISHTSHSYTELSTMYVFLVSLLFTSITLTKWQNIVATRTKSKFKNLHFNKEQI